MAHLQDNRRVLSRPCEVNWAGFKSNTFALQQAGWNLAIEQDFALARLRLLISNREYTLTGFSVYSDYDYFRRGMNSMHELGTPVFNIVYFAPRVEVLKINDDFSRFKEIDAMPQFINSPIQSIEDLGIFAAPKVRTEEIIVDPVDVFTLLEQIKKMQSPQQAEIREKNRRRDYSQPTQQQTFHAQIISLNDFRAAA